LVDGEARAFPDESFQQERNGKPFFNTVLSLRIDRQNRLWTLDHAAFGQGQPRLLAFDLTSRELVHQHDFSSDIAGFGSFLNDFQVTPDGSTIFIADTGLPAPIVGDPPAIIIYDIDTGTARRVLEGAPSVTASSLTIRVDGEDLAEYGIPIHIGVDSIALDREGEWLYFAAVNAETLFRIEANHLMDENMGGDELAKKVEAFAPKTMSDGITTDDAGNIYISDMEYSAVHIIGPDRRLQTVLKDPMFRWPDGFSFGPDGWLYFTCSDLMNVIGKSAAHIDANAPYQIYRFKPGYTAAAGH
jgi:sugar lactone lactonase YvrE